MTDVIAGILLLVVFGILVYYCCRGGDLMLGFLVTSVLWCIIGRVPFEQVVEIVFQLAVENYGKTISTIIFGAWFGRVLVETGIAGYIIEKITEFAGEKALTTAILLNVACSFIFCSAFGVGSVMAIGMIVLPILFSLGIDKVTAVGAYMLSVAAGMFMNVAYVSQFYAVFPSVKYNDEYLRFGAIATLVSVVVMIAFLVFNYIRAKNNHLPWTVKPRAIQIRSLPKVCMMVPFVPIIMVALFKWPAIPSFLLGIVLGLLFTKNMTSYDRLLEKTQKTLYDGIADSGLLIGMLYSVNILQAAAHMVASILQNLLGDMIPKSPVVLVAMFCIFAPLALFRGPLMIWGAGIAMASILQAMGIFQESFLFMLFLVPPVSIVASACPTQSWTMWVLNYAKLEPKDYMKSNLPWAWFSCIVIEILAYLMIGRV